MAIYQIGRAGFSLMEQQQGFDVSVVKKRGGGAVKRNTY